MKRRLFIYLFKTLFVLYKCSLCVFIQPWIYPKLRTFLSFFAHTGPVLQVGCCPRFWRDTTQLTIGQHRATCILFVPEDREKFVSRSGTSGRGSMVVGTVFSHERTHCFLQNFIVRTYSTRQHYVHSRNSLGQCLKTNPCFSYSLRGI